MAQNREREETPYAASATSNATLSVRWVQGFPKQDVHFINEDTICYPSGNYVIFINIETKKKTVLQCINGIVGVVATNIPYEVVAFSDRKLKPNIYIYNFPGLTRRTKLKGNILLDYTLLAFSYCGTYLASYSSLPEFELALWNWESNVILCKKSQPGLDVSQLSFNPMNWRQLCLSSPSTVNVWTIERSNQEHYIKAKSVKLPLEDGTSVNETDVLFPHSLPKDPIYGPVLPLSAIAGLVGEEAETFRGSVCIYTFGEKPTIEKVLDACDGKFLAFDFITPGTKYFMTLTHSGEICTWCLEDCTCESKIYLNTPSTALACSPSSYSAVVGTVDGSVYFLDVQEVDSLGVVHKAFLSKSAVQHLSFDQRGIFLFVGSSEGNIFIINAIPSSSFQILGFVEVSKDILQISTVSLLDVDVVQVMVLSLLPEGTKNRVELFTVPQTLPKVSESFTDERGKLKEELIDMYRYEMEHTLSSAVLDFQSNQIYGFCNQVPYICSYLLPEKAVEKEIKMFSHKRKEIKRGIKELARTVLNMMEENDKLDDIAKLEQHEFGLDLEELERLKDESEEEVAKIRKDAEMYNLAKSYLTEVIKEECWNAMAVKGRALKCFHIPYVVENFPMKGRPSQELKELKKVLQQKKIEAECLKLRKDISEVQSAVSLVKKRHEEDDEEEEDEEKISKDSTLPNYLLGSLSTDFGVDTSLLSSQLELHSREEKINQIILLKDIIYKVKTAFNNEFDAAYKQKEFEITRVTERNVRIREIISDLELEETVWQPEFEDCEKPERTLVVEDHEGLDVRARALMDMMGGVLEVKKEDILRMVIPQPAFMAKPDALWTEEERKQFKEYEKKVKELNEERDKYRKSLETELKKLQNAIQESTQSFDEQLKRLFERRVKAEMVVNQEELKISNLVFSLLLDEELTSREVFLNNYLVRKQEEKNQTSEAIRKSREDLEAFKEHYDNLMAEDKVLDRSFKKEFSEVPSHQVDILYKLFKRRPRIHKQKTHSETASNVPFGERPGSAKLTKDTFAHLMKAMDELDNINNMPEGLDPSVWEHFCATRRAKVENEHKVKQKATGLVEMMAFLRKRVEDDEQVQREIEKVFRELVL
ncbi:Cilia- and flagella-associated protein 43 [Sciurus carolinensis]|uniref:Cilia- and flagella-associated protein 43 n=1 Tax=Sciurus carolinensis TaxID=30640 RepID=A0AA41MJQ5_SCICA|nr:Cilia- and flagella-associated protein 43 [Sciurus carolinensis]